VRDGEGERICQKDANQKDASVARFSAVVPVSYTTVKSRTLMSLPKTWQGAPARTSLAVSVGPSTFTLVALYPGQASKRAGSTSSARATSGVVLSNVRSVASAPQSRVTGSILLGHQEGVAKWAVRKKKPMAFYSQMLLSAGAHLNDNKTKAEMKLLAI
jgi:hypothetical protein